MKNGLTPELLAQAKTATSAAELLALAAEKGIELTPAEAASYYLQLHPQSGALPDEELDNVAGGGSGCYNQADGRLVVTNGYLCDYWTCPECHQPKSEHVMGLQAYCRPPYKGTRVRINCGGCAHCNNEAGILYCNHPANRR